jgi:hypothetical protein
MPRFVLFAGLGRGLWSPRAISDRISPCGENYNRRPQQRDRAGDIKLFSEDPDALKKWATKVGDTIKKIPGVVDVENGLGRQKSGARICNAT